MTAVATAVAATLGTAVFGALPAAAATPRTDSVALAAQSPSWIGPDPAHQVLGLALRISSSAPRRDLGVQLTVYHHLGDRFHLNETLTGRGLGTVATRSPVLEVRSLPADAEGNVRVTVPVVGDTAPAGAGSWTADLGCQPGGCAGVYPVKVALVNTTTPTATSASFVTYLIYDNPVAGSQPLRVSSVVPEGLPAGTAAPSGRQPGPKARDVTKLEGLVASIANSGEIPLTLIPDPASLEQLTASGHERVATAIAGLSASATRQTLAQSFVPVDPTALVDTGLGAELNEQIRRASQVFDALSPDVRVSRDTWVLSGTVDAASLAQLATTYSHVVVPPAALSGAPPSRTTTQPFTLTATPGGSPVPSTSSSSATPPSAPATAASGSAGREVAVTSAVVDPALGAHLAAGAGSDPVLAAVQFLADASLIYYELPNLSAPRAVIAAAPTAWGPDPSFVTTMLAGMVGNPVLSPVTIDQVFQQVAVGADGQPTQRRVATPGTGSSSLPARSIRPARAKWQAFSSAVSGTAPGDAVAQRLDDLLLLAESNELSTRQQQSGVAGFNAALDTQLHQLSVRSDTVRLTSGAASVPITVLRNAPYAVTAVIQVTSDKLVFPRGASAADAQCKTPVVQSSAGRSSFSAVCVLDHGTTAVYIDMRSRASGDFRIDVTVSCPQGALVLASGHLTVRSMSTSAVAIVLSAAAALVLLVWWARTLWRNRFGRRAAHRRAAASSTGETSPSRASTPEAEPAKAGSSQAESPAESTETTRSPT